MKRQSNNGGASVAKLAEMIKDVPIGMLTTVTRGGVLRSRPMANQPAPFDGTLWFFTDRASAKTFEIARDSQVNVSYADPGSSIFVSVSGTARVYRDKGKAKELWNPAAEVWYPKGPTDPRLMILEVTVTQAQYWDPRGKMVQVLTYVKALVTGKRPVELDHANHKLTLRRSASRRRTRGRAARR